MSLSTYYIAQQINHLQSSINSIIDGTAGSLPTNSNLATVLTNGNSAGTQNIDVSNNDILQVDNINLTTINSLFYPTGLSVSFVPEVVSSNGGAGVPTYGARQGLFTRIGKIVFIQVVLFVTSLTAVTPGEYRIPLPAGLNVDGTIQGTLVCRAGGLTQIGFVGVAATNFISFRYRVTDTSTSFNVLQTTAGAVSITNITGFFFVT